MEAEQTINEECNCNDEFRSKPCPVHFIQNKKKEKRGVDENGRIIVTDDDMVKDEIRQWAGFVYECPVCEKPFIMDTMSFCGNCGVEVIFQSVKLTNFIKELSKRYGGKR